MSVRTVVVAHRETLAAEGIAAALGALPGARARRDRDHGGRGRAVRGAGGRRRDRRADPGRRRGRRPAARSEACGSSMIGEAPPGETKRRASVVGVDAPVAHLASALAPGARPRASGHATASRTREAQVLRLAAKGMAGKQIARVARHQSEDGGATQDAGVQATRRAEPGRGGGRADRGRRASVEPIHYLRALRRRWWVIAAVRRRRGRGGVGHDGGPGIRRKVAVAPTADGYAATIMLWNPRAPIVGQPMPVHEPRRRSRSS